MAPRPLGATVTTRASAALVGKGQHPHLGPAAVQGDGLQPIPGHSAWRHLEE